MRKTLRDRSKKCCLGKGQITEGISLSYIMGGGRDSEEIPFTHIYISSQVLKETEGDLQDLVTVTLK